MGTSDQVKSIHIIHFNMRLIAGSAVLLGLASAKIISLDKEEASQFISRTKRGSNAPGKDFVQGFQSIGNGIGGAGKAVGTGIADGATAVGKIASGVKAVGAGVVAGADA